MNNNEMVQIVPKIETTMHNNIAYVKGWLILKLKNLRSVNGLTKSCNINERMI